MDNYIIKCGNNYIGFDGRGRPTEVNDINKAWRAPMHKMSNLLNNCVAPDVRKRCKIMPYQPISTAHVVVAPAVERSETSLFDDIMSKLKTLGTADFDTAKDTIVKNMSHVDQEITDIQHYIEFNHLNAAEGYKAYKLLQDKLLERRAIKDDYSKFQMLADAKVSDIFDGTLEANIEKINHRVYTPRVLKELF